MVEHREDMRQFEDKATLTDRQRQLDNGRQSVEAEAETERRLAEEEESAVVAEIQRVTRAPSDAQEAFAQDVRNGGQSANGYASKTPTEQRPRQTESRQSRLQRVCQNQSFYIYENEYPEAKGALSDEFCIKIGGRGSTEPAGVGTPLSRGGSQNAMTNLRLDKSKNLFRESPDFILTTGSAKQTAAARNLTNSVEANVRQFVGLSADGEVENFSDRPEEIPNQTTQHSSACLFGQTKCRVLNLDHNFEFVGSHSGHKYFVEKELESRDVIMAD